MESVSKNLFDCHRWWREFKDTELWLEEPLDAVLDVIRDGGLDQSNQVIALKVMLARSSDRCQECNQHSKKSSHLDAVDSDGSDGSDGSGGSGGSDGSDDLSLPGLPSYLRRLKIMKNARNRALGKPRAPRIKSQAISLPAQSYLPLPMDNLFDDYFGGPKLEDLQSAMQENKKSSDRSNWDYFKDYGYRLLPDFAVNFNQQDPIQVSEHLLPIGEPEFQDPSCSDTTFLHHHLPTNRMGKPREVLINDVDIMGMEEMLNLAGNKNSSRSIDLFVCGKNPIQGNYVCLQPEQDAVSLTTSEVQITLDIDSIIWVTHHLHVLGSLKVNVMPYFGNKPPIPKNNHCEVEILYPQSTRDQDMAGRSEWFTKAVPISTIPHIHFAQAGDGSGSVNFYVAFPRMIHKNPHTGHSATLIPSAVQIVWLTQILLPAMRSMTPQEIREYVDFTYDEWKWKATVNNHLKSARTVTLDPITIENVIHHMRLLISQNSDHLGMFGSFFFIADIRGIKLNTVTIRGRDTNPLFTLFREIPTLDWKHMLSRENGQLLLDLGISYHPDPVDNQPLIGLWKLNSIHASYAKAGMNKPQEFKTCTMPRHGGLQGMMESSRRRTVQLPFRSTYNLIFEAFRRPGQEEKFCSDPEAYANTAVFQQTCHDFVTLYQGAKRKSFGVREEVRGSGSAIIKALRSAWHKVCF